jgi:uncharacterized membrane protein YgdD (TMEM256/DUF423 family)
VNAPDTLTRRCFVAAGLLGAVAVAAGAFGAHGLREMLEATGQTANWETAFRYALVHAVAVLACGIPAGLGERARRLQGLAAGCFVAGTLIFSGCLAALALSGIRVLGAIVPIGGLLLIGGWLLAAAAGVAAASARS